MIEIVFPTPIDKKTKPKVSNRAYKTNNGAESQYEASNHGYISTFVQTSLERRNVNHVTNNRTNLSQVLWIIRSKNTHTRAKARIKNLNFHNDLFASTIIFK